MNNKVFIIILVFSCAKCLACSCIGYNSTKKEFYQTDVIFSGKAISKKLITVNYSNISNLPVNYKKNMYEVTFISLKVYKGVNVTDTIRLITGFGHGDCGFEFELNKIYIVYSVLKNKYFEDGEIVQPFLETNICNRTRKFERREIRKLKRFSQ
jgi:hypothetical protein